MPPPPLPPAEAEAAGGSAGIFAFFAVGDDPRDFEAFHLFFLDFMVGGCEMTNKKRSSACCCHQEKDMSRPSDDSRVLHHSLFLDE